VFRVVGQIFLQQEQVVGQPHVGIAGEDRLAIALRVLPGQYRATKTTA
jgi:hypothetical protein